MALHRCSGIKGHQRCRKLCTNESSGLSAFATRACLLSDLVFEVASSWYLDTKEERNVAVGSEEAAASRDTTVDFCTVPGLSYRSTKPERNVAAPTSALEFPKAWVELVMMVLVAAVAAAAVVALVVFAVALMVVPLVIDVSTVVVVVVDVVVVVVVAAVVLAAVSCAASFCFALDASLSCIATFASATLEVRSDAV